MKRTLLVLLFLVALFILAGPALAQDATAEPTAVPTEVVTPPPVVTPEPPVEQPPTDESLWAALGRYGLVLLAGISIGLGSALGLLSRIKNDKPTLDAIEWAGRGISPEALEALRKLAMVFRDAGEVLDVVTDGKPNVVEPPGLG